MKTQRVWYKRITSKKTIFCFIKEETQDGRYILHNAAGYYDSVTKNKFNNEFEMRRIPS